MGVDIRLHIISEKGKFIKKDFYDGRNSKWFAELREEDEREELDFLPIHYGIPKFSPEEIRKDYNNGDSQFCWGFFHMPVKDYCKWYLDYKPNIVAGWVSKYDAWLYHKKDIFPHDKIQRRLYEDDILEDMEFEMFIDKKDQYTWLYEEVKNLREDDIIVYYFY